MQTYTAKLKQRRRLKREIPDNERGWWIDVSAGRTLQLRDATSADIARCYMRDGTSKNPADYLCELSETKGSLVSRKAVLRLAPNASVNPVAAGNPVSEANEG